MPDSPKKFSVVQLGARMHYAIPLIFYESERLEQFITDFWYPNFLQKFPPYRLLAPLISRTSFHAAMQARFHPDLENCEVSSFDWKGISYSRVLSKTRARAEQTRTFLDMGIWFTSKSAKLLPADTQAIYAFNTAAKEIFAHQKFSSSFKVLEQTLAPRKTERTILTEEYKRRNLSYPEDKYTIEYEQREQAEWELADIILCGSDFVKKSMIDCGADSSKIKVIPYGVSQSSQKVNIESTSKPLHVLFAGNGGIRKGLPYLLDAVSAFQKDIVLHIAGNTEMPDDILKLTDNVILHGQVPRAKMHELYQKCDIFALPSLCEGSATVIYEAMANGLAIICTPNSGSVISDNQEGLLIPIADSKAIQNALQKFLGDDDFLVACRQKSLQTSKNYTVEKYRERILEVV